MKLLYITVEMPFGANETFFIPEIKELRRQGHQVLIVPRSPKGEVMHGDAEDFPTFSRRRPLLSVEIVTVAIVEFLSHPVASLRSLALLLKSRNLTILLKNLMAFPKGLWLSRLAKQWGADHIHAQWASTTGSMAMVASEITGIPWSCTAHRWDIAEDNLLAVKINHAAFFRFISQSGIELARSRGVGAINRNVYVIHMGVSLPPAEQIQMPVSNAQKLLCVANLLPVKGHRYLLEAISLLKQRGVECYLDVAGDGPLLDELLATVGSLDIEDRTRIVGILPHNQLLKLYRDNEIGIVVLPSIDLGNGLHEGIPVSLIEAMSYGVPVVSTTTGGIPELLRGGAGVLVRPKDSVALADAIERLLGDCNLRQQLSEAGRRRVEDAYGVERVVSQFMRLASENNNALKKPASMKLNQSYSRENPFWEKQ